MNTSFLTYSRGRRLAAAIALLLTACGPDDPGPWGDDTGTTGDADPVLVDACCTCDHCEPYVTGHCEREVGGEYAPDQCELVDGRYYDCAPTPVVCGEPVDACCDCDHCHPVEGPDQCSSGEEYVPGLCRLELGTYYCADYQCAL